MKIATFPLTGARPKPAGSPIQFTRKIQPILPGEIHIWRLSCGDFRYLLLALLEQLTCGEREYADKFRNAEAREQFIIGRAFLRTLLSAYMATEPSKIKISRAAGGKLFMAGPGQPVNFNVSHSNGTVVLAFARDREVGIDLESHTTGHMESVAHRILPETEARLVRRMPSSLARTRFTSMWSRMEACAKATGAGVVSTLRHQRQYMSEMAPWCRPAGIHADMAAPNVRTFRLGSSQVCSVASFGANWTVRPYVLRPERRGASLKNAGIIRCRVSADNAYEPI